MVGSRSKKSLGGDSNGTHGYSREVQVRLGMVSCFLKFRGALRQGITAGMDHEHKKDEEEAYQASSTFNERSFATC